MTSEKRADWQVSVVIPTIGRPELFEAVQSALSQTKYLKEVVIGADTADDLNLPTDSRIRVVRTGPRAGGNVARMAAVRAAQGDLVAFLDDDDLWSPNKLQVQLDEVQRRAQSDLWLSSTLVHDSLGRRLPRRLHKPGERLPHYLFRKERTIGGQGFMFTPTLVFPKELLETVALDETLKFHQDSDWFIRLDEAVPDLEIIQVTQPLTELRTGGESVSRGISPRDSLSWAKRRMAKLDRRTRGDFLITVTYFQACQHRDLPAAFRVLKEAFLWGRPGIKTLPSLVVLPLKVLTGARLG